MEKLAQNLKMTSNKFTNLIVFWNVDSLLNLSKNKLILIF